MVLQVGDRGQGLTLTLSCQTCGVIPINPNPNPGSIPGSMPRPDGVDSNKEGEDVEEEEDGRTNGAGKKKQRRSLPNAPPQDVMGESIKEVTSMVSKFIESQSSTSAASVPVSKSVDDQENELLKKITDASDAAALEGERGNVRMKDFWEKVQKKAVARYDQLFE